MKILFSILLFFNFTVVSDVRAQLYTLKNNEWNFSDTNTYVLILKNNKNCLKCFTEISEFLTENFAGQNIIIASVSKIDSSVFARKMESKEIAKLMPNVTLVLFEYNSKVQNSIFSNDKVHITPCLLVIKGNMHYFYGYEDIYVGKNINKEIVYSINKQIGTSH